MCRRYEMKANRYSIQILATCNTLFVCSFFRIINWMKHSSFVC